MAISVDDVVDVRGGPRQDVRRRHAEGGRVGDEALDPAVRELVDGLARGLGSADDLVVDVGDVHDPGHAEAAVAEVADQQVGEQERPEVADVGRAVDRRSAAVDPDVARLERHERPRLTRERVLEAKVTGSRPGHVEPRARPPGLDLAGS